MNLSRLTLPLSLALAAACVGLSHADKYDEQALMLAKKHIIIDTHIDVPYRLKAKWADVSVSLEHGDFDYPRAVKGGLDVPFMSIYIPASHEMKGGGLALANGLIDAVESIVYRAPDKFVMVDSVASMKAAKAQGKIGLALGMENGTPIEGKLENLHHFYQRGIRYITLAHSKANHISDSSYDTNKFWQGLSPFGVELVKEMNNIGMMVDISHVSDQAFYDVMTVSKAPVIASHSSARHFVPGFERNMDDKMIKALGKNHGLIMINFGSTFVTAEANEHGRQESAAMAELDKQKEGGIGKEKMAAFKAEYRKKHPFPFATVDDVADHVDRVVKLAGIESVGIGSDYDGVGDSLPVGLKDVSSYPALVAELLRRGYKEKDIEKFLGGNLLRVLGEVEKLAANSGK